MPQMVTCLSFVATINQCHTKQARQADFSPPMNYHFYFFYLNPVSPFHLNGATCCFITSLLESVQVLNR